jgi:hypothetical protein
MKDIEVRWYWKEYQNGTSFWVQYDKETSDMIEEHDESKGILNILNSKYF